MVDLAVQDMSLRRDAAVVTRVPFVGAVPKVIALSGSGTCRTMPGVWR